VVTRMVRACCVAAVRPWGLRRVITVAQLAPLLAPPGSTCSRAPHLTTVEPDVHVLRCAMRRLHADLSGRLNPKAGSLPQGGPHRAGHWRWQHSPAHQRRGQRQVPCRHRLVQLDGRACSVRGSLLQVASSNVQQSQPAPQAPVHELRLLHVAGPEHGAPDWEYRTSPGRAKRAVPGTLT
jgi:hypothetical protein